MQNARWMQDVPPLPRSVIHPSAADIYSIQNIATMNSVFIPTRKTSPLLQHGEPLRRCVNHSFRTGDAPPLHHAEDWWSWWGRCDGEEEPEAPRGPVKQREVSGTKVPSIRPRPQRQRRRFSVTQREENKAKGRRKHELPKTPVKWCEETAWRAENKMVLYPLAECPPPTPERWKRSLNSSFYCTVYLF